MDRPAREVITRLRAAERSFERAAEDGSLQASIQAAYGKPGRITAQTYKAERSLDQGPATGLEE